MDKDKQRLSAYYEACDNVARAFIEKLFEKEVWDSCDPPNWVGDESGGVLCISDMFVQMDAMVQVLENDCTYDDFYGWYWEGVEKASQSANDGVNLGHPNFRSWLKLNKGHYQTVKLA